MTEKIKVLIADDELKSVQCIEAILGGEGYELAVARTGEEAFAMAVKDPPDIILLDAVMPDTDGFETCRRFRLDAILAEVPIIMVSGLDNHESRLKGIAAGVDDFLTKPVDAIELRARVRNVAKLNRYRSMLKERENAQRDHAELFTAYEATLAALAKALEANAGESRGHTNRVVETSLRLGRQLGITEPELTHLRWSVLLHDIGSVGAADSAFREPSRSTVAGKETDRSHTARAYEILSPIPYLQPFLEVPYCHHENWDGSGYPQGLKGEEIPLAARIFAVADAWNKLRFPRDRKQTWPDERHRVRLREQAGKQFDPQVVDALLKGEAAAIEAPGVTSVVPAQPGASELKHAPRERSWPRWSLAACGARAQFGVAVAMISAIPMLALVYLLVAAWTGVDADVGTVGPMTLAVALLMGVGYRMLAKYPLNIVRLREYLEGMAKGVMPQRIRLSGGEDDLTAIESLLRVVVAQTDGRIRTIETQTRSLLDAERQRVMIESIGAACHHLGQPATVLCTYLDMARRMEVPDNLRQMLNECREASVTVAEILERLQRIAVCRTEPYIGSSEPSLPEGAAGDRIVSV